MKFIVALLFVSLAVGALATPIGQSSLKRNVRDVEDEAVVVVDEPVAEEVVAEEVVGDGVAVEEVADEEAVVPEVIAEVPSETVVEEVAGAEVVESEDNAYLEHITIF